METSLFYPDLSYRIIGCCFAVYNNLGSHYREAVYHKALEVELAYQRIAFESKKPIELKYRGISIGEYELDLVVERRIILELKAVEVFHPQHLAQLIQYLQTTGLKLGILINFGDESHLAYRRVPHESKAAIEKGREHG